MALCCLVGNSLVVLIDVSIGCSKKNVFLVIGNGLKNEMDQEVALG